MFSLYIWTIVASMGMHGAIAKHDWRYMGEYKTQALCESAVKQLGIKTGSARCIHNGK